VQDLDSEWGGWDLDGEWSRWDLGDSDAVRFGNCRVEFGGPAGARRMTRITCELTGTIELYEGSAGRERLIRTIDHDTIETYSGEAGMEVRTSMETGGFIHYYSGAEETLVRVADATTGQSLYSDPVSRPRSETRISRPHGPVRAAEALGHHSPSAPGVSA
jgi:hypothetical protein